LCIVSYRILSVTTSAALTVPAVPAVWLSLVTHKGVHATWTVT